MPGIFCTICNRAGTGKNVSIATLKCGHVFHENCIIKSFEEHKKCPYCEKFADSMIRLETPLVSDPIPFINVDDIIDLTKDEDDELVSTLKDQIVKFSSSINETLNDMSKKTTAFIGDFYKNATSDEKLRDRIGRARTVVEIDTAEDDVSTISNHSRSRSRSPLGSRSLYSQHSVRPDIDTDDEEYYNDVDNEKISDHKNVYLIDRHGKEYDENGSVIGSKRNCYSSKFKIKRERFSTDYESVMEYEVARENVVQLNKVETMMENREKIDGFYSKERYYELLTRAVPMYFQQYFEVTLKLDADCIVNCNQALEQLMNMLILIMPDEFTSDCVKITYYSNVVKNGKHYGYKIQFFFRYPKYSVLYIDDRYKLRNHKYYSTIYKERYYSNRISQHLLFN
ncbi:putative ubiquitine ligase [Glossina pallidipes salivary gland hypertrophy virus]|uniref:Putative ubiquitine ligase n=1 Tax=Glossina hytrovirus (isolate Glossina pallidipes/Ethiopia/Seibersdorf/-) TaxID=379529 RepID=A0A0Y0GFG4_GHVS|nr:putative ubiquitine ligase [Glossina pallidipes salivary gland hypertrophy virus]